MEILIAPERRTKTGMMPSLVNPAWSAGSSDRLGWFARIGVETGGRRLMLDLSRFDDESGWTIDAAVAGGFPLWANGFGARYLITKTLAADLAASLDAAVAA